MRSNLVVRGIVLLAVVSGGLGVLKGIGRIDSGLSVVLPGLLFFPISTGSDSCVVYYLCPMTVIEGE